MSQADTEGWDVCCHAKGVGFGQSLYMTNYRFFVLYISVLEESWRTGISFQYSRRLGVISSYCKMFNLVKLKFCSRWVADCFDHW